jgi:hypothetical protein
LLASTHRTAPLGADTAQANGIKSKSNCYRSAGRGQLSRFAVKVLFQRVTSLAKKMLLMKVGVLEIHADGNQVAAAIICTIISFQLIEKLRLESGFLVHPIARNWDSNVGQCVLLLIQASS